MKKLKRPPIYAEISAKKQGQEEEATAEFCIPDDLLAYGPKVKLIG